MPLLWRRHLEVLEDRKCSFCHKRQDAVGRLISNPVDYPRAFICNECVAVCHSIAEDAEEPPIHDSPAKELLAVASQWIARESKGEDATEQLSRMRSLARLLFSHEPQ